MPHRTRLASLVLTGSLLLSLVACAADPWLTPHAQQPTAFGTPHPGFFPTPTPSPEATISPQPGSWEDVHPPAGYRVLLLTIGDAESTRTVAAAVTAWASQESVDLRTVTADASDPIAGIVTAMDAHPDLIVSSGDELIDPLALVSPNHLDQQFLLLGAELAEPTGNVTAVDWTGAGFRGEGLGTATHFDPDSFTPERSGDAVRAGVTSVLTGMTGVVLWLR